MTSPFKDSFLEQSHLALHITNRDIGKRLTSAAVMLWVCHLGGVLTPALVSAFVIAANELVARGLLRAAGPSKTISLRLATMIWANYLISTLPYLSFSVYLAAQPSVPLLLVGFIWLFAIFVNTANTFVLLPIYNWSQMVPAYGGAFAVLWVGSMTDFNSGSAYQWFITVGLLCIYIMNTYETMKGQTDTQTELIKTRAESTSRLRQLEHLSQHDALTGLSNRGAFERALEQSLSQGDADTYMLLIDLDDFKPINDSYSHQAGDAVLRELGQRLRVFLRPQGTLARLGGDEFALLRHGLDNDVKAVTLAVRIVKDITRPILFEGKELAVGASIGVAKAQAAGDSVEAICARADQAMYKAKNDPNRHVFCYDPAVFPKRATLDQRYALKRAIAEGQIKPHYQPKVCISSGRTLGFEALARWHHQEDGLLLPADFLPMVREFGLSGDLVLKSAERVLADLIDLTDAGLDPGQVSLNIPEEMLASQTGRNELSAVIDRQPHLRKHLTFEITEDVFIARSGGMIASTIEFFRNEGIRISLDDFGTGFASFQHLRDLEFDELKLDTGFVSGLGRDPAAAVLVEGFLGIGRGLGVQIVAEGVETEAQRQQLLDMGCKVAQGYLFSPALELHEAKQRLQLDQARATVA